MTLLLIALRGLLQVFFPTRGDSACTCDVTEYSILNGSIVSECTM